MSLPQQTLLRSDKLNASDAVSFSDTVTKVHKNLGKWKESDCKEYVSLSIALRTEKHFFSKTKRDLVCTDKAVYVFKDRGKTFESKRVERRIPLEQVKSILIDTTSKTVRFVLHLWDDKDVAYESNNTDERDLISQHVVANAYALTKRTPEEAKLTFDEIDAVMRTDESSSSPLRRDSSSSVTGTSSPSPSLAVGKKRRHVSVYVPSKDDSGLSEVGRRLKNLILAVNVPPATKKYYTYLFDWPTSTLFVGDVFSLLSLLSLLCVFFFSFLRTHTHTHTHCIDCR
jgi:hypothetical protein